MFLRVWTSKQFVVYMYVHRLNVIYIYIYFHYTIEWKKWGNNYLTIALNISKKKNNNNKYRYKIFQISIIRLYNNIIIITL